MKSGLSQKGQTKYNTLLRFGNAVGKKNRSSMATLNRPEFFYVTNLSSIFLDCMNEAITSDQSYLFKAISNCIKKSKAFFAVRNIPKARIPIIKFKHKATKKECDLSFSNIVGVGNTHLIKFYISVNPNLRRLVLFVKYLLRKYDLHGCGKVTTFMLFWFAVYYMQQKDLLPPVTDVRKLAEERQFFSEWDCSVPKRLPQPIADPYSLFSHLIQFLKFYSDFEFMKHVISPYLACTIPVQLFTDLLIPPDLFSTYLKKMETAADAKFSTYLINFQDPTAHNFNLTKQVEISALNKFKTFCFLLHNFLTSDTRNVDILGKLCPASIPLKNVPPDDCLQYFNACWYDCKLQDSILEGYTRSGISFLSDSLAKAMKNTLKFKVGDVYINEVSRVYRKGDKLEQGVLPTAMLDCSASNSEWTKVHTSVNTVCQKTTTTSPIHVFIVLETYNSGKQIRVYVESKANFIRFFKVFLGDYFLKSGTT